MAGAVFTRTMENEADEFSSSRVSLRAKEDKSGQASVKSIEKRIGNRAPSSLLPLSIPRSLYLRPPPVSSPPRACTQPAFTDIYLRDSSSSSSSSSSSLACFLRRAFATFCHVLLYTVTRPYRGNDAPHSTGRENRGRH